jgi:hypothetical protein
LAAVGVLPVELLFFYPGFGAELGTAAQIVQSNAVCFPDGTGGELDQGSAGEFGAESAMLYFLPGGAEYEFTIYCLVFAGTISAITATAMAFAGEQIIRTNPAV